MTPDGARKEAARLIFGDAVDQWSSPITDKTAGVISVGTLIAALSQARLTAAKEMREKCVAKAKKRASLARARANDDAVVACLDIADAIAALPLD